MIRSNPIERLENVLLAEPDEQGLVEYDTYHDECIYEKDKNQDFYCPECGYIYRAFSTEGLWKEMVEEK